MTATADPDLHQAILLHRQGQVARAAQLYRRVLSREPQQLDALQMLGLAEVGLGNAASALGYFERAVRVAPRNAVLQFNRGLTLMQLQRLADAMEAFDIAIAADPAYAKAHLMRATALHGLGRQQEALDALDAAAPKLADPAPLWMQKGAWLYADGETARAIECFEEVLARDPAHADAWVNLGSALIRLGRLEEAVSAFDSSLATAPGAGDTWFNRGIALAALKRWPQALASYGEAVRLQPSLGPAWMNRGVVHSHQGALDAAIADFEQALRLQPDHVEVLVNLGNALLDAGEVERAAESYERVLALQPERDFVFDTWVQARMRACDWRSFGQNRIRLEQMVEAGVPRVSPTRLFPVTDSAALQRRCAEAYIALRHPAVAGAAPPPVARPGDRIRIGYFSADFFAHATAFLMARMFECHDRTRFEPIAFSFGDPPRDAMHMRLRRTFSEFHAVGDLSDRQVVDLARERGIDIAIDLKGLSQHARPDIFALRAAPVQVAYLGYPSTLGAPYLDYLVADATLVPPEDRVHYSEKIISLPHSYQANDNTRALAPPPSRASVGLPPEALVFCSFNSPYKITPDVFDVWMRLLLGAPGSVLWQLEGAAWAKVNLRREAAARGVDPARLVFAPTMEPAAHLARIACADLFLDTLPCNAHTTASDALWAGVPVLTCLGGTFAGRVSASLLRAVDLPELVTASLAEYEALGLELARDPRRLAELRARLAVNRRSAPLFDTVRFTRGFEAALATVHQRHLDGLPPDHVIVAAR